MQHCQKSELAYIRSTFRILINIGLLTSNVTVVTEVRSASYGLVLHVQHIFANSFNFLVIYRLPVTISHSTCIFCV